MLDSAIREKLPPTPLESSHIVSRIRLPKDRRRAVVVQYIVQLPIEISSPDQVASRADEMLRSFD